MRCLSSDSSIRFDLADILLICRCGVVAICCCRCDCGLNTWCARTDSNGTSTTASASASSIIEGTSSSTFLFLGSRIDICLSKLSKMADLTSFFSSTVRVALGLMYVFLQLPVLTVNFIEGARCCCC